MDGKLYLAAAVGGGRWPRWRWRSYGGGGGNYFIAVTAVAVAAWRWYSDGESSVVQTSVLAGGWVYNVLGVSWGGRRVSDIVLPRTIRFSLTLTYLCSHGKPPPSVLFCLSLSHGD